MKVIDLGKLAHLPPRDVWPNEALDFTPWLAENIDRLGEALGMDLELIASESPVGSFSLDLLAKDLNRDRAVVIENQLERTDHDHLGKLITYASAKEAGTIVWIAQEIREEHRQALDWLNQRTDSEAEFFGVVVEVLRIGDSLPAANFKLVAFPNEFQKTSRGSSKEPTARSERYRAYYQLLIDELREKHHFTGARLGQPQNWYAFASGISGFAYSTSFAGGGRVRVELYIDFSEPELNKAIFDLARSEKDALESKLGLELEWDRLDDKRASRVAAYRDGSIDSGPAELEQVQRWTIEYLLRFKEVFGPRLSDWLTEAGQVQ